MRSRRGFSLVECLATIALTGTAMTTVAVSMSGMHRACQRVREETTAETELQRLAVQLRADAHEALSAQQENVPGRTTSPGTLRLILSGEEAVQYTVGSDAVHREHRRNEEVLHRETYRLPSANSAQWKLETSNSLPVLSLRLAPEPVDRGGRGGCRARQVTAAVGLLRQAAADTRTGGSIKR